MSTEATEDNKGEGKPVYRVCGVVGELVFESVYYNGKPEFLIFHKGTEKFMVAENLLGEGVLYLPYRKDMYPYRPYTLNEDMLKFINSWVPSNEEIYKMVYEEVDTFLDMELIYKILEADHILETYQQHKIISTSHLGFVGEPESGKSNALEVINGLGYRTLSSASLPAADVYRFLGDHEEGCGTILEDDAERLDQPRYEEKMKLYKSGYKKGKTVPRMEFTKKGTAIQRFFNSFCCKDFAMRYLPNDTALRGTGIKI
jgi:hypothetical protein